LQRRRPPGRRIAERGDRPLASASDPCPPETSRNEALSGRTAFAQAAIGGATVHGRARRRSPPPAPLRALGTGRARSADAGEHRSRGERRRLAPPGSQCAEGQGSRPRRRELSLRPARQGQGRAGSPARQGGDIVDNGLIRNAKRSRSQSARPGSSWRPSVASSARSGARARAAPGRPRRREWRKRQRRVRRPPGRATAWRLQALAPAPPFPVNSIRPRRALRRTKR
jgi:hypothetical protein